jgi:hypothetical protein
MKPILQWTFSKRQFQATLVVLGLLLSACGTVPQVDSFNETFEAQAWTGTRLIDGDGDIFTYTAQASRNALYMGGLSLNNLSGSNSPTPFLAKFDVAGNLSWNLKALFPTSDVIRKIAIDDQNNAYVVTKGVVLYPTPNAPNGGKIRYFLSKVSPFGRLLWRKVVHVVGVSNISTIDYSILSLDIDSENTLYLAIADGWLATFTLDGNLQKSFIQPSLPTATLKDARARRVPGEKEWLVLVGNVVERRSLDGALLDSKTYPPRGNYRGSKIASVTTLPVRLIFSPYSPDKGELCISAVERTCEHRQRGKFVDLSLNPSLSDFTLITRDGAPGLYVFRINTYRINESSSRLIQLKGAFTDSMIVENAILTINSGSSIFLIDNPNNLVNATSGADIRIRKYSATGVQY